ncbi:hypothetical protein [Chamaesiphon polymorphus]|nr:hypothetical protein [Chamaesiphon polymorphus]
MRIARGEAPPTRSVSKRSALRFPQIDPYAGVSEGRDAAPQQYALPTD